MLWHLRVNIYTGPQEMYLLSVNPKYENFRAAFMYLLRTKTISFRTHV
jgi:hypothetical protein